MTYKCILYHCFLFLLMNYAVLEKIILKRIDDELLKQEYALLEKHTDVENSY